MDGKDKEKMVITAYKPVASRPSNLKLLSRILNSAFNDSPSTSMTEATIVIRPKNLRFEPSRFVTSQVCLHISIFRNGANFLFQIFVTESIFLEICRMMHQNL